MMGDVLLLVPHRTIILFVFPEVVFFCPGGAVATAAIAEDGVFTALSFNVGNGGGNHLNWHNRCYLNCGLLICFLNQENCTFYTFSPKKFAQNPKPPYLCIVFFIVLDLRLTKVGVRRYSFFCAYKSKIARNHCDNC